MTRQRGIVPRRMVVVESLENRQLFALAVQGLPASTTATSLTDKLVLDGTGLTVTGGTYIGNDDQGGTYTGLDFSSNGTTLVIPDGVLLTSGDVANALPPNNSPGASTSLNTPGDTDLDTLTATDTHDANTLTFTFTADPSVKSIIVDFVFASEEFYEFVGQFNDAFGVYLDGTQISFDANGDAITVNNNFFQLNNAGQPIVDKTLVTFPIQYDGLTPHISTQAPLVGTGTHTIKFTIADAGDTALDSGVFISGLQGSTRVVSGPTTSLPVPGTLQFSPADPTGSEASGLATITVTRIGGSTGKVSANYNTIAASATAGADYTSTTSTVVFLDGETTKTITIPIIDDTLVEDPETFTLHFSNPVGGVLLPANPNLTVTIINNDSSFQVSTASTSASERLGTVPITITRAGATTDTQTVNYATADVTAVAGSDYTSVSGTLSFAPGEASKVVDVPIALDTLYDETPETFTLTLSGISGSNLVLGAPSIATITILNFDPLPPTATVAFQTARKGISLVTVLYSEALDVTTALDIHGYTIWDRGDDGRNGSGKDKSVKVKSVSYDSVTHVATLTPKKTLSLNKIYQLSLNSPFIADVAGNRFDGDGDGAPGNGNFFFGRGTKLNYIDRDGDRVTVQVNNGGVLELIRNFDGEGETLTLLDDNGSSTVTGLVKQTRGHGTGTTTLAFSGRSSANALNPAQFQTPV